jgi:hypothetical protein
MTKSKSGTCHPGGLPGPNSEFLEDRCTNRAEPYTVGKGSKRSTRQSKKASLGHDFLGACQDRIANF